MDIRKITVLSAVLLLSQIFTIACSAASNPEVAVTDMVEQIAASSEEPTLEQVIRTPTPQPTATPGPLVELVEEVTELTGFGRRVIFGLSGADWINLIISILIVIVGIYVLTHVFFLVIQRVVKRTPSEFDDRLLEALGSQLRTFLGLVIIQFATERLPFLRANLKQSLNQIYFIIYIFLAVRILWRLLDLSLNWYKETRERASGVERPSSFLEVLRNALRLLLVIVAGTILLNHFGINVTALIAILGIGGLALSLAAQDTLADIISGFIILFDQPYRIGDRIEISELNTWGDVVEVGARTTRIQTRDNRVVIVPNSKIGKSQIVNYSYPDPHYRLQVDILVNDKSDLEEIRQIMIDTVKEIDGVLEDKPINALVQELGDGAIRFRVRWWIDSFADTRDIFDRVNTALYYAFKSSGIKLASESYDLNVFMNSTSVNEPVQPKHRE